MRAHWFGLLLLACGPPQEDWARTTAPVSLPYVAVEAPPEVNIPEILSAVTRVRGIKPKAPIPIEKMSDLEFDRAMREVDGVADPGAPASAVLNPQFYDGFYSSKSKTVRVRSKAKRRDGDRRLVIAHEMVHALQDQQFGIDKVKANAHNLDEMLAIRALLEGDAQVAAYGAIALIDGIPPDRVMIITSANRADDDAAVAVGQEVAALPYGERMKLLFPYEEGERFVGTLYRAGRFDLVNRVYDSPPQTTAFILHPDAYLAGLPIRPVAPMALPRDAKPEGGRIGEAGLRMLLVTLGAKEGAAANLAQAWRGDWLGAGTRPDGTDVGGGVFVFSNDVDAEGARSLLATRALAARRGSVVSFASGLSAAEAQSVISDGYTKPGPPPVAYPPFGTITIPPAPVPIERQARFGGTFDGRTFTDPGVGLVVPVLGAYNVTINGDLLVRMSDGHAIMGIALMDVGQSPWARAQVRQSILTAARKVGIVQSYSDATIDSPFGTIPERSVLLQDGRYFRMAMAPICNRMATLLVVRVLAMNDIFGERNQIALDHWLASIDATGVEASAFCAAVKEEWRSDETF